MELRFDAMLHSVTWVTKLLIGVISNVQAGRRFPTPTIAPRDSCHSAIVTTFDNTMNRLDFDRGICEHKAINIVYELVYK